MVSEVTLCGTHLGDFVMVPRLQELTLEPNGRRLQVKHIHHFRLLKGKIVEHFAVRADLGRFQQLGRMLLSR